MSHTDRLHHPAPDRTEGESRPGRFGSFLLLMLELILIAGVVYLFDIEGYRHLFPVLCVIVGGFAIHAWLPMEYRIPFFALLCVACVLFVLGMSNGLWVLGIGAALIGVCYLPVGFRTRLILLVAVAGGLVLFRARFPLPFWPVLGSMFMFRLLIFVYERRHETSRPPLAESVAYFFMLPNPCFPLFPVVDYRTFRESWYSEDELEVYQRGVTWIVRGIVHLMLYRYIKLELLPEPHELVNVGKIALFMATNYALYLQVSGQFHLITGILHLFGFNLPRTHYLYFLASGCSDIWRRINIYWKDFLARLVFFPAFHAARGRGAGAGPAIVFGVMGVFVSTWLLHSWQTFWLLGRFPLTVNDACLWLVAGVFVAVNGLFESGRRTGADRPHWQVSLGISLRTVAMFGLVSMFWACWTRPGFLMSVGAVMDRPGAFQGVLPVLMWVLAAVLAVVVLNAVHGRRADSQNDRFALSFRDSVRLHVAGLGVVLAFSSPWFGHVIGSKAAATIAAFQLDPMRREAAGRQLHGYYEDLNLAAIQAGPLLTSLSPEDEARRSQGQGFLRVSRPADPYLVTELIPGIQVELEGSSFSVNQFGLRDRESITLDKPPNTTRIAFVGSSIVMGYGVGDDEVFSRSFESRLNARRRDNVGRYEVLNFGVGKQWPTHRLVRIRRMVFSFEPDAVFYFAHQDEFTEVAAHPARLVAEGLDLPSRHLADVVQTAGVQDGMAPGAIASALRQHQTEMLSAVYRTIVDDCRIRGINPVYVYLHIPGGKGENLAETLMPLAEEAGFIACDLSDWAEGRTLDELFGAVDGEHPDKRGHALIADALIRLVESRPEVLAPTE